MTTVIETAGLTKYYGSHLAVDGLDLNVAEGEIFGFLGPNGAGKTTTIRILMGFLKATAGHSSVFGLDCWNDTIQIKGRIGFLPDAPSLYSNLSGLEFLDYLSRLMRNARPVRRQSLCDLLELSQADLRRKIKGYSHGMQKKIAIVQAAEHDPDLLIMDEPTEALDPLIQQALFEFLLEFQSRGRTIFFSSHNLPEVERLCSRVGIIRRGTLVAVEEVQELRKRKLRQLEVVLARDSIEDVPDLPGVVSSEKKGRRLRFLVRGEINPVVRELAKLELEDLVFEQPHLDDIFLDYYRADHDSK